MDGYENQGDYLLPNQQLNLQAVLDRFQRFRIEQKAAKDQLFERQKTIISTPSSQTPVQTNSSFSSSSF